MNDPVFHESDEEVHGDELTEEMLRFREFANSMKIRILLPMLATHEESLSSILSPKKILLSEENGHVTKFSEKSGEFEHHCVGAYLYEFLDSKGEVVRTTRTCHCCEHVWANGQATEVRRDCRFCSNRADEQLMQFRLYVEHSVTYLRVRIDEELDAFPKASPMKYELDRKKLVRDTRNLKRMIDQKERMPRSEWRRIPSEHVRNDQDGFSWFVQDYVRREYRDSDGATRHTAASEGLAKRKLLDSIMAYTMLPFWIPFNVSIDLFRSLSQPSGNRDFKFPSVVATWDTICGRMRNFRYEPEVRASLEQLMIEESVTRIKANRFLIDDRLAIDDFRILRRESRQRQIEFDRNSSDDANVKSRAAAIVDSELEDSEEDLMDYVFEIEQLRLQLDRMRAPKKVSMVDGRTFTKNGESHYHSKWYYFQYLDVDNRWVSTAVSEEHCNCQLSCTDLSKQAEADLAWMIDRVEREISEMELKHRELVEIVERTKSKVTKSNNEEIAPDATSVSNSLERLTRERDDRIAAIELDPSLDDETRERSIESIQFEFREVFLEVARQPFTGVEG